MCMSPLSFQTTAVKLAHMPPHFNFNVTKAPWHSFMIMSYSPTTADTSYVQVIQYVWREEIVHAKFMTYPFYSPSQTSHC